jgi:hypothetical protein
MSVIGDISDLLSRGSKVGLKPLMKEEEEEEEKYDKFVVKKLSLQNKQTCHISYADKQPFLPLTHHTHTHTHTLLHLIDPTSAYNLFMGWLPMCKCEELWRTFVGGHPCSTTFIR